MTRTLESLEKEREQLLQRLQEIDEQIGGLRKRETANNASQLPSINKFSTVEDKINLYRSLFKRSASRRASRSLSPKRRCL